MMMKPASHMGAEQRDLREAAPRAARLALVVAGVGLAAGVVFGVMDGWEVFFRSYLLNFAFVLSLALGALFFVLLQHLTRAGWSVSLRRLAELGAGTLPGLAVLFVPLLVPVLAGMGGVYEWADPHAVPTMRPACCCTNEHILVRRSSSSAVRWSLGPGRCWPATT